MSRLALRQGTNRPTDLTRAPAPDGTRCARAGRERRQDPLAELRRPDSGEKLEGVPPVVAHEPWNAPQHAERLDGTGRFGLAHVGGLPAELLENAGHGLLRSLVVAA